MTETWKIWQFIFILVMFTGALASGQPKWAVILQAVCLGGAFQQLLDLTQLTK